MRQFVLVSVILGFASAAKLNNLYLPPNQSSGGSLGPAHAPLGGRGAPSSPSGGAPGLRNPLNDVPIVKLLSENIDGTYRYDYETGNGIAAQEQGDARGDGTKAQGSFSFTAPNGEQVSIIYTADENGFVPQGSAIPTPPPIPEAILKSLEENAAAEAKGIFDDGQYRGDGLNEGQYKGEGLAEAGAGPAGPGKSAPVPYAANGGYRY
ncbi:cuticle protein 3-like [Rhynchophorus ferrugineus]|uniref:cuticle protein 3-like n=1 Tax=Rhynchophorus ferrugineus TaxID=354439 RepID=UPI003FCC7958